MLRIHSPLSRHFIGPKVYNNASKSIQPNNEGGSTKQVQLWAPIRTPNEHPCLPCRVDRGRRPLESFKPRRRFPLNRWLLMQAAGGRSCDGVTVGQTKRPSMQTRGRDIYIYMVSLRLQHLDPKYYTCLFNLSCRVAWPQLLVGQIEKPPVLFSGGTPKTRGALPCITATNAGNYTLDHTRH